VTASALRWYRLRWPREVAADELVIACRLLATVAKPPLVLEAVGSAGRVEQRLGLSVGGVDGTLEQLRAALPGLGIESLTSRPELPVHHAVELRLSTRLRPLLTDDLPSVSRAILTALAQAGRQECVNLQWVLGPALSAQVVSHELVGVDRESWLGALLLAPFAPPPAADAELRSAVRAKRGEPGWRAVGRIAVAAESVGRERQLIEAVIGAVRSTESPGVRWTARRVSVKAVARLPRWRWPLRLNASELAAVSSWPAGVTNELPVAVLGSRPLPPSAAIPRRGRVIGEATFPGRERPLALSVADSRRHLHVLGPTGTGKSTLLLNLITQDMAAGRAVVVIEPRGDLIAGVLERVPPARLGDVVLFDPTDRERPVGLNPLAPLGRSPELVADQLLGLFHALYAAHWGPRTQDILGASLLTLARTPGMTLTALPRLLTDAGFRRRVVPAVADPIGLTPFWQGYEAWSQAERAAAIAPVMNKLRPLLLRPDVRAIIAQRQPRFALTQVFTERKVLLVNLAAGQIGPETSALLGSFLISQLWQAILGRSAIAPERRHPVSVVLDEFQTYLHLPLDLTDALAQARGLGACFALAHQYLHQLDPAMRSAVLANAQSRIAFRLPADDARVVSAGSALLPEDFQGLGAFEGYAQLVVKAAVQPWCSLRTLPASEPCSDPALVRTTSRLAYGVDRTVIEAELAQLSPGRPAMTDDDLTPRKRGRREP
jgi:hypothetical protein